jgi:hypothetical protein
MTAKDSYVRSHRAMTAMTSRAVVNVELPEQQPLTEAWISHACSRPTEPQAEIVAADQNRRHPYGGERPIHSGYCVVSTCACRCHQGKYSEIVWLPEVSVQVRLWMPGRAPQYFRIVTHQGG